MCMRCYDFGHIKSKCSHPDVYKICSECAELGHRFNECQAEVKKCINCQGEHRTLALRCPVRKRKVKEIEENKKRRADESTDRDNFGNLAKRLDNVFDKIPNNFAIVVTSAIIFAKMEEAENPGSFQDTIDKILDANKVPRVRFPRSLFTRPKPAQTAEAARDETEDMEEDRTGRKRDRSGETDLEGAVGGVDKPEIPSLASSLTSIPAEAMSKQPKQAKTEKKKKKKIDPNVVLAAPNTTNLSGMSRLDIYKELALGRRIKYFYTDRSYNKEGIRKQIKDRYYEFESDQIWYVDVDRFYRIPHGGFVKMDEKKS